MPTLTEPLSPADLAAAAALRRDLHRHPELSHEETRTAGVVEAELRRLGLTPRTGLGGLNPGEGTGVIADLPAVRDGTPIPNAPIVALRADMDALPILEATGAAHASTTPGVMHACGHDGHTAGLLATARALAALDDRPNTVRFVFQPAEEGGAGGEKMCRDGVMDGVARIFGLHGWPGMPLGRVGTRPGPLLAATDDFTVRIRGVGGHAAMPHFAKDPVLAASAVVQSLQQLASRNASPLDSVVCTVATINAGHASNVIPEVCTLAGTIRTLRAETRALAERRFNEIVTGVASAHGCEAEIDFDPGYPVTHNDEGLTAEALAIADNAFGVELVERVAEPFMGGEDFSYYGHHAPACFFLLGLCPEGIDPDTRPRLHQDTFDFNDDALPHAVRLFVALATAPVA